MVPNEEQGASEITQIPHGAAVRTEGAPSEHGAWHLHGHHAAR